MAGPKPVVAVDFDDVVAGFNMAYHQWHNKHFGTTFTFKELVSFDMCALYNIDTATLGSRVSKFVQEHHGEIVPIAGVKKGLQRLSRSYDLHIVTSRCESLEIVTKGWLTASALEYFQAHHFTNGFNSLFPERRRRKLEVCREIGAIALIEDADTNALEVAEGGIRVFMPVRPWNGRVTHTLISRLSNWEAIATEILKIA